MFVSGFRPRTEFTCNSDIATVRDVGKWLAIDLLIFAGAQKMQVIESGLVDFETISQRRIRWSRLRLVAVKLQIGITRVSTQRFTFGPLSQRRPSILGLDHNKAVLFLILLSHDSTRWLGIEDPKATQHDQERLQNHIFIDGVRFKSEGRPKCNQSAFVVEHWQAT